MTMGRRTITVEPHELVFGDTTIRMQGDPSADQAWDTLMGTPRAVGQIGRDEAVEALAALAHTPADADTLRGLDLGGPTINAAVDAYVELVIGFPLERPSSSTKRSKGT